MKKNLSLTKVFNANKKFSGSPQVENLVLRFASQETLHIYLSDFYR